jgi:hypothetical protein
LARRFPGDLVEHRVDLVATAAIGQLPQADRHYSGLLLRFVGEDHPEAATRSEIEEALRDEIADAGVQMGLSGLG